LKNKKTLQYLGQHKYFKEVSLMSDTGFIQLNETIGQACLLTYLENNVYWVKTVSSRQEGIDEFIAHFRRMFAQASQEGQSCIKIIVDSSEKTLPIRRLFPAVSNLASTIPYIPSRVALILPVGLETAILSLISRMLKRQDRIVVFRPGQFEEAKAWCSKDC
jgi:hypothetical protein